MVSLSALPALQLDTDRLASPSPIEAFRQGTTDQLAENQRNLLRQVGNVAATGNYLDAARTAMRGGDLETGMTLTKYKSALDTENVNRRLQLLDFFGRGAQGADTPEKWQALVAMAQGVYGQNANVAQFTDFNKRPQIMSFLADTKTKLEAQKLQLEIENEREKLTGAREDRAFQRDLLTSFGMGPSASAAPPPSYNAPTSAPAPTPAPSPSGTLTPSDTAIAPPSQPPAASSVAPATAAGAAPAQLTTQEIVARMSPAQKSSLGLLLAKKDYEGASKLIREASGEVSRSPPQGYRWNTAKPTELEPIPGGPASKLPAETAGKVGMMRTALQSLPALRNIFLGEEDPATGQRKGADLGVGIDYYLQRGDIGEGVRLGTGAIETVLRVASGAAVPQSEVDRYEKLFMPTPFDTQETRARKLDALERWIGNMVSAIQEGRPIAPEEAAAIAHARTAGKPQDRLAKDPSSMSDDELKQQLGIR